VQPKKLFFLPGAGGNRSFWQPASDLVRHPATREFIEWPGIGGVVENTGIQSVDDLAHLVVNKIDSPTAIIAQSMGGVVALLSALERPEFITHIVLCATSGGIDISDIRSEDWRLNYHEANPTYPRWFTDYDGDLTEHIGSIDVPVLLIWGDADPISPIEIGQRLKALFVNSRLEVIVGGDHGLAATMATTIAPLIENHLNHVV
jgi:pimeloyl-ACP methyl ester carboxylesterase